MTIYFNQEARQKLQTGVDTVANAVKITLGPRGRNVVLGKEGQFPIITNDGVSIAKSIKLEDKLENMGVDIAKETAIRTDMTAGDGTTTTLILLQEIIKNGLKMIDTGVNVIQLNEGIQEAAQEIVEKLKEKAIKVTNLEVLRKAALVSVENEYLADTISKIIWETGINGDVTVVETNDTETKVEKVEAYHIDTGFANPYVINNPHKMTGEYNNIPVLVTDKKIFDVNAFIDEKGNGIIKKLSEQGHKTLLLIADDIDGPALQSFYMNAAKGYFMVVPVRFKTFGEGKLEELEDIAMFCGTKVIGDKSGITLNNQLNIEELGLIENLEVNQESTYLYGGQDLSNRVKDLEELLKNTKSKEIVKKRIANLSKKIAVIKVGAQTETQRKYLKLKIDDAVNACRGALEMGVVEGGGYSLFLEGMDNNLKIKNDKDIGKSILYNSLQAPYKQLLANSGVDNNETKRYNALTGEFVENLLEQGVLDPVKVSIAGLLNASSSASTILTIGAILYE